MAYKFQLGAATKSGSLTQEGDLTVKDGGLGVPNNGTIGTVAQDDLILFNSGDITIKDGTFDFDIAAHDGTNGLKLGGNLVSASAAELNYNDGVTAGTVTASKTVVVSADKDISAFRNLQAVQLSASSNIVIGGADINEADLEKIDGITNGTVAANKALVADASTLVKFANGSKNGILSAVDTDNAIQFGNNQEVTMYYNAAGLEGLTLAISSSEGGVVSLIGGEAQNAAINLTADEHDDAGDMWEIACQAADDKFTLSNDIAEKGTMVEHFSITPNATVSNSTAAFAGNVTVAGNLTISGTTTTVDTTNTLVKDKLITLNDGGADNSARGAGIEFEENSSVAGFMKTSADGQKFEFKVPEGGHTLTLDIDADKTLTINGSFNIDADITTPAANINLLSAGAGSSVSVQGADGIIIFDNDDSNNAKKVLVSDVAAVASTNVPVALIDNLGTGSLGVNYWADLGGAEAMVLPASPSVGDSVKVKAPSNCSSTNTITISPLGGSHTIDGASSIVLESPFAAVELVYVSASLWRVF